jgi:nucleoside-diphosphate-sugar epimerase
MTSVLILGGSGFLGSALAEHFVGLDLKVTRTSTSASDNSFIRFDISESGALRKILEEKEFSYIVNLIGRASSVKDRGLSLMERESLFNQFNQSSELLKAHSKLIHVGSCAEYGSAALPYLESTIASPVSEYGRGKLDETNFFQDLASSGIPVVVLRPSIVFGAGQKGGMLVPSAIETIKDGRSLVINQPNEVRDFLYVEDFVQAVEAVLSSTNNSGQIYNVAAGIGVKLETFISELEISMGVRFEVPKSGVEDENYDANKFQEVDVSKIRRDLNWAPNFSFKDGIRDMVSKLLGEDASK